MKEYPKMWGVREDDFCWGEPCIAFYKEDGSNLRFEWNKHSGWYKFGTRRRLFDQNDPEYGQAIAIFLEKYGSAIIDVVQQNYKKIDSLIAYGEFFGPHSFAGKHDASFLEVPHNDPKDVVLFDINLHKKGFIDPEQFVKQFGHLHVPKIIYKGPLTPEFVENVRNGVYPVQEGVVVKGGTGHSLWMKKIKTFSYLQKLREKFGTGWSEYWE